jgi:ABC-type phosphate/phosphonate transport system substrate-binding protein
MWNDPKRTNLVISASEIANLRGRNLLPTTNRVELTFAVNINSNPVVQVSAYAPLLECLQENMGAPSPPVGWARLTDWITSRFSPKPAWQLGQPVIFDLKFCKIGQLAFHEIVSARADFQRLGAVSYLRARDLSPGVQAVVQEDVGKEAVFLVRSNSPITNLSQFAGRRFAFGDTNSTISVLAKLLFMKNGVHATNLFYTNLNESVLFEGSSPTNLPVRASGAEGALRVLSGEFDGAVLQRWQFDRLKHQKPGLREVYSFRINPNVWVARAGLDPAKVRAFKEAMLSIKDRTLLAELDIKPPVESFHEPDEEGLRELYDVMKNVAAEFDALRFVPSPARREGPESMPRTP